MSILAAGVVIPALLGLAGFAAEERLVLEDWNMVARARLIFGVALGLLGLLVATAALSRWRRTGGETPARQEACRP